MLLPSFAALQDSTLFQITAQLRSNRDDAPTLHPLLSHATALATELATLRATLAEQQAFHDAEIQQLQSQSQILAQKLLRHTQHHHCCAQSEINSFGTEGGGYPSIYKVPLKSIPPLKVEHNLEKDNRLLKSDLRFYKQTARDAEATTNRLTAELKHLRASLLNGAPLVALDHEIVYPWTLPPSAQSTSTNPTASTSTAPAIPTTDSVLVSTSKPSKKRRLPLMGDAEAEHLLLAGHRLSHLRRIIRVPLSRALVQQAEKIVEKGVDYVFDAEAIEAIADEENARDVQNGMDREVALKRGEVQVVPEENVDESSKSPQRRTNRPRAPVTPRTHVLPPTKSPLRSTKTPLSKPLSPKQSPSPAKARQSKSVPHSRTASRQLGNGRREGGSKNSSPGKGDSFSFGLNELIEAAQTLDESLVSDTDETDTVSELGERGGRDEEGEDYERKRRKVSTEGLMDRFDRDGSITVGGGQEDEEEDSDAEGDYEMDDDYLEPSTSKLAPPAATVSPKSPLRQPVTLDNHLDSPKGKNAHLSPLAFLADQATSLLPSPRILRPPSIPLASTSFLSPSYNPRPTVPLASPSNVLSEPKSEATPEKSTSGTRPRSPYLRWEMSEDEALVKAILKHGQRWEFVAQSVPSRTYHQCRQRWLRGLKSGDSLPEDLAHHRPAVKLAIHEYEAARAKNKGKELPLPAGLPAPTTARDRSSGPRGERRGGD